MSLPLPALLRHEGERVLAIPLGSRSERVLSMFSALRRECGHRVEAGGIEEWRLEGFCAREGGLYLYGRCEPGVLLEEAAGGTPEELLPRLLRLARALALLEREGKAPESLQTDAVFFLESGGVLFLPPAVMKQVRQIQPSEYGRQVFELVSHPELARPQQRLSFFLGALLYRAVAGRYPFEAGTEEEIHERARRLQIPAAGLLSRGLRPDAAGLLLRALNRQPGGAPGAQEWAEALELWLKEGLLRPVSPEQRQALQDRARTETKAAEKGYGRRVFWRRQGRKIAIVAGVVLVLGIFAGTYLRNLLQPPVTRGYSPRQVVEAFFQGMNTLDHALMEACTTEGAAKETIREVVNLYVLSRVSLGYEGTSNVVPADAWDRAGRPALESSQAVFGATDLRVREVRGEPEPVFAVSYTQWSPVTSSEAAPAAADSRHEELRNGATAAGNGTTRAGSGAAGPTVKTEERKVEARFYLKRTRRGDWAIYRIEAFPSSQASGDREAVLP